MDSKEKAELTVSQMKTRFREVVSSGCELHLPTAAEAAGRVYKKKILAFVEGYLENAKPDEVLAVCVELSRQAQEENRRRVEEFEKAKAEAAAKLEASKEEVRPDAGQDSADGSGASAVGEVGNGVPVGSESSGEAQAPAQSDVPAGN